DGVQKVISRGLQCALGLIVLQCCFESGGAGYDVASGHGGSSTLERVNELSGARVFPALQCRSEVREKVVYVVRKEPQKPLDQDLVAENPGSRFLQVDTGQDVRVRGWSALGLARGQRLLDEPLHQSRVQNIDVDGLGDVVVHARGDRLVAILVRSVGRRSDDR